MAGLMCFLYAMKQNQRQRAAASILAGLAFASAFGLSVWVAVTFGVFFALWMMALLLQKEHRYIVGWMALSGVLALALASPFIAGVLQSTGPGAGGAPVELYIRPFSVVSEFLATSPNWLQSLINLLVLPVNYLFELGFFLIVALLWLQRYASTLRTNPIHFAEALLVGSVTVFLSFVHSTVIYVNDMGIRGWLVGQFMLVVWGTDLLASAPTEEGGAPRLFRQIKSFARSQKLGNALSILAVIGVLTSAMEITATRTWPMLIDAGIVGFPNNLSPDIRLGARTFAARQAYDFVSARLLETVVMQSNPTVFLDRPGGLYGSRQTVIADRTAYGVPPDVFSTTVNQIGQIFMAGNAVNWDKIDTICRQHFIEAILVSDTDPLWQALTVLEQQRSALYKNGYYALFICGQ
jgi:hypothetical protein